MNVKVDERLTPKLRWIPDPDYDIEYLPDVMGIAVPECETCGVAEYCDQTISCCLGYGMIEIHVVIVK